MKVNKPRKLSGIRSTKSIKARIMIVLILICVIPLSILGSISYNQSYNILYNNFIINTQQTLTEINREINIYFSGISNEVGILSNNLDLQQLEAHPEYEPFLLDLMKNIKDSNGDITDIYFAEPSKKNSYLP